MARPDVEIPNEVKAPFPLTENGFIVSGFGRGSSELGIPTANVPISSLSPEFQNLDTGVYFGFSKLEKANKFDVPENSRRKVEYNFGENLADECDKIYPHVMSVGWNPFYNNTQKTAEIHIIHKFPSDFYGAKITFNILGYIRPELDYTTKDALIADINIDIETALKKLDTEEYSKYSKSL